MPICSQFKIKTTFCGAKSSDKMEIIYLITQNNKIAYFTWKIQTLSTTEIITHIGDLSNSKESKIWGRKKGQSTN